MDIKAAKRTTVRTLEPWLAARVLVWFQQHARDLPWRLTADPYPVWVSEIMLQQTQVKTVIPYFERWMRELPTVQSLAAASSQKIHKLWEGLGYYTRVRNMQRAARVIVDQHGGIFPRSYDHVLALPGVGRYTAGAICSIAFNEPAPIVDGNIVRFLARFFGIRENLQDATRREQIWTIAAALVTHAACRNACSGLNQGLMEMGATVCTPRNPRCDLCPVSSRCIARKEHLIDRLPNIGKRPTMTPRRFITALVQRRGKILVRQRPRDVVNAHLWEFPSSEVSAHATDGELRDAIERELGCRIHTLHPFARIRHSITRYRVSLDAVVVELDGSLPRRTAGTWKAARELHLLPFSSAHGKLRAKWQPASPVGPVTTRTSE